jgi:ribosomal protein S27E
LPFDPFARSVKCAHCRQTTPVSEELRAEMSAYVHDVRGLLRDELVARYIEAFFARNVEFALPVIGGSLGIAYALVFGIGAWCFARSGPYVFQSHVVVIALIWIPSLLAFTFGWVGMYGMPSPEAMARQHAVRCGRCGAVRAFGAGAATAACRHCGATLLVPVEVASRLLFESVGRAADADRLRTTTLQTVQRDLDAYVAPSVVTVVVGVTVGVGGAAVLHAVGGTPASAHEIAVLLWLPPLACLPWLVWAPIRARRWMDRVDALAAELESRLPPDP